MTYEQKQGILKMRLDGFTIQEIADKFGTTRQNISLFLNNLASERKGGYKRCKCVYPGLRAWMFKNKVSALKLLEDLQLFESYPPIHNRLSGKKEFTLAEIKEILAYTGLTFEEAFGVVEPLDGADQDAK